jgi:hypothetical protein
MKSLNILVVEDGSLSVNARVFFLKKATVEEAAKWRRSGASP